MEKDKKVTALYCRLSKDDGSAHESLSIRTQKAMLMEYATRNGFGNCQYYVDDVTVERTLTVLPFKNCWMISGMER